MKAIFTYPSNASTQYVDPNYLGTSTTNGFAKRVADVMDGTYKTWLNPTTPDTTESGLTDIREFIGRHPQMLEFVNGANTVTRQGMYYGPMIQGDTFTVHTATSNYQFQSQGGFIGTNSAHGLYSGMKVDVSGFSTTSPVDTTVYNGNSYYVEKINDLLFRLHTDDQLDDPIDLGTDPVHWTNNLSYAFGYDAAISEDKEYIAVSDVINDGVDYNKLYVFKKDSVAVGDPYRLQDLISASGVLDVAPDTSLSDSPLPGYNGLGGSGLKINNDGSRLFAHAYDTSSDTAYIAYYTRSGTTWTLSKTWTFTNQAQRIRFDTSTDGTVIAIRTSGESGTNAQLYIETESGGTWTNQVTLDLGVEFWGEVQLDSSGDYCVVEKAGSSLKFLYTTDNWATNTTGAWHSLAHGSVISEAQDNDVIALWQSGGTVRVAASPWNGTEGAAPSFYDYNPGTDTLTLEEEFVGFAARKFMQFNSAGDRVLGSFYDDNIPGAGGLADYERKVWVYERAAGGDWSIAYSDTRENSDYVDAYDLKIRAATSDLTSVNMEIHDETNARQAHVRVVSYGASSATRNQVLPDITINSTTDPLNYAGSITVGDTVTVTASSDEPFRYRMGNVEFFSGGNFQRRYYNYNNDQYEPGAMIVNTVFIAAHAGNSTGIQGADKYNLGNTTLPVFDVTTDSNGWMNGVGSIDPQFPGRFASDLGSIAFFTTSQPNLGVAPAPASTTPAEQEDIFDTEDEWTVDNYVKGPSPSDGKVWPAHVKPRAIRVSVNNPTVTTRSQNGIKYVRDLGFQKLTLEVDYPPMTQTDFDIFMARLQMLRGGRRPFWFDLRGTDNVNNIFEYKGSATGNVHFIAEDLSTGDQVMLLEGFQSNESDVVKYNTTFSNYGTAAARSGQVTFAANDVDANIYGETKVRVTYPMQSSSSAGQQIYFQPVYVICTLVDDNTDFDVGDYRYTGFTIRMELDEFK